MDVKGLIELFVPFIASNSPLKIIITVLSVVIISLLGLAFILVSLKWISEFLDMESIFWFKFGKRNSRWDSTDRQFQKRKEKFTKEHLWWEDKLQELDSLVMKNSAVFLILKGSHNSWKEWMMMLFWEFISVHYSFKTYELWGSDFRGIWSTLLKLTDDIELRKEIQALSEKEDIQSMPRKDGTIHDDLHVGSIQESETEQLIKSNTLNKVINSNTQNIIILVKDFHKAPDKIKAYLLDFYKGVHANTSIYNKKIIFIVSTDENLSTFFQSILFIHRYYPVELLPLQVKTNLSKWKAVLSYLKVNFDDKINPASFLKSLECLGENWYLHIGELRKSIETFTDEVSSGEHSASKFVVHLNDTLSKKQDISNNKKRQLYEMQETANFEEWVKQFGKTNITTKVIIEEWRTMFLKSRYENLFERCQFLITLGTDNLNNISSPTVRDFFRFIILIHEWELHHQKSRSFRYALPHLGVDSKEYQEIEEKVKKELVSASKKYEEAIKYINEQTIFEIGDITYVFQAYLLNNKEIIKREIDRSVTNVDFDSILKIFPIRYKDSFINIYWLIQCNRITEDILHSRDHWISSLLLKDLWTLKKEVTSIWLTGSILYQIVLFNIKKWDHDDVLTQFSKLVTFYKKNIGLFSPESRVDLEILLSRIYKSKTKYTKKQLSKISQDVKSIAGEETWRKSKIEAVKIL